MSWKAKILLLLFSSLTLFIIIYGVCCVQEFSRLADDMMQGRPTQSGPTPPNMIKNQWSFLPPVIIDTAPIGDLIPHPSPPPPPPFLSFCPSCSCPQNRICLPLHPLHQLCFTFALQSHAFVGQAALSLSHTSC